MDCTNSQIPHFYGNDLFLTERANLHAFHAAAGKCLWCRTAELKRSGVDLQRGASQGGASNAQLNSIETIGPGGEALLEGAPPNCGPKLQIRKTVVTAIEVSCAPQRIGLSAGEALLVALDVPERERENFRGKSNLELSCPLVIFVWETDEGYLDTVFAIK